MNILITLKCKQICQNFKLVYIYICVKCKLFLIYLIDLIPLISFQILINFFTFKDEHFNYQCAFLVRW